MPLNSALLGYGPILPLAAMSAKPPPINQAASKPVTQLRRLQMALGAGARRVAHLVSALTR